MSRTRVLLAVGPVLGLTLAAGPAAAHDLGAECKLRDGRVEVEAYFDDGSAAAKARVNVLGEDKRVVAEGRTDAQGRWSFPAPAAGVYQVVVHAGGGHRVQVQITVPEGAQSAAAVSETDPARREESATPVSHGPSREEFTRRRWLPAVLGVGILLLGGLGLRLLLRSRRSRSESPSPPQQGADS